MKPHSPIQQFPSDSSRRFTGSCYQQNSRDQRASSVTSISKVIKVTVHSTSNTLKQIVRPIERRTVQLYEKPKAIEFVGERMDRSSNESMSYILQRVQFQKYMVQDSQVDILNQENVRLMQTIQELHGQLETWNINYSNLTSQGQDRNAEIESYKSCIIENYMTVLNQNYESFSLEMQSLRFELSQQKTIFSQAEGDLLVQIERQRNQLEGKDIKLNTLSVEIDRINFLLLQKQSNLDQTNRKDILQLETQIKVRDDILNERNNEIGLLRRQVQKSADLENVILLCKIENERLYSLIDQSDNQLGDQYDTITRLESCITLNKMEISRLNQQVHQQHEELSQIDNENRQALQSSNTYIYDLEYKLEGSSQQSTEMNQTLNMRNDLISIQKEEIILLKSRITEFQQQISFYQIDMNELLMIKQSLSEQINGKNKELDMASTNFNEFDMMISALKGDLNQTNLVCQDYSQKIQFLSIEIESLNDKLQFQSKESDQLQQNIYEMETQFNFNQNELEEITISNQQKDQRLNNHSNTIRELEEQLSSTQDQHRVLHLEGQRMQSESKVRLCEVEGKLSLRTTDLDQMLSENEYEKKKNLTLIDQYRLQLQGVVNEKQEQNQQNLNLKQTIISLEGSIDSLEVENQRLNYSSCESNKRINDLLESVRDLENKVQMIVFDNNEELSSLRQDYGETQQQTILYTEKINHQNMNMQMKDEAINQLNQNYRLQQEEFQKLSFEYESISQEREQAYTTIESSLFESNETNTYLVGEIDTWKQKFILLNREFHTIQEEYMLNQAEFEAFKQRQLQIKEYTTFEIRKSVIGSKTTTTTTSDKENFRRSQNPLSDAN